MSPDRIAEELFSNGEPNAVAGFLQMLPAVFAAAGAQAAGPIELMAQRSLREYTPTLLSPPETRELARRGLITPDEFNRVHGRAGYSNRATALSRELARALLDGGSLAELTRRGTMTVEQTAIYLRSLGYSDEDIQRIQSLRFYVPTAQDVIRFAVREIYTPEIAQRYGQYENFPVAGIPDFERAGLDRTTAEKYWAAHWELPSMSLAFQMLQRSAETGVTLEDVHTLLRANDVMPFWRDKIVAVSYNPLTRVDIRRMHKAGVLNRADIKSAYKATGYNDTNAELLTQFTEKLNNAAAAEELAPFVTKFRTHAERLYLDGLLTESELAEQFVTLGLTQGEAEAYVNEAAFVKEAAARKIVREAVRTAYEGGHIDQAAAAARLREDGYDDAQIVGIMAVWHVVRELRALSAKEAADRDLTKTEILTAYEELIIDAEEARSLLIGMRYSEHEVDVMFALAEAKVAKARRSAAEGVQKSLFLARRITAAAASKGLVQAGVTPTRIESLLTAWQQELDARAPTLTKAEIGHAVAQEFMAPPEGASRLERMGYSKADVSVIIQLATKGVVVV